MARGQEFQALNLRQQQEYVISTLLWENLEKSRGPNAQGQSFSNHFGFIECSDPDAFVQFVDGVHYCGLNTGLVRMSFYLADEIVLIRDIFAGLGHRFEHSKQENLDLFPEPEKLREREGLATNALLKASPSRISMRDHFAHLMVTFSIYHEFNHAVSGHSAFLAERKNISRLHEYGSKRMDGLSSELHNEVEYTADMGATETMFDYVHRGTLIRRVYKNAPSQGKLHRLFLVVFAVICAQWHRMNQQFGEDGLHPEPAARFVSCLRLYTLLLQEHFPFWRWPWIGRGAVKDVMRIAYQCEDLVTLVLKLGAYDQNSDYWATREPDKLLVRQDDVKDFVYPYAVKPKPYKSKELRKAITPADRPD